MSMQTVMAATCQCTMGAAPTPLMILPDKMVIIEGKPAANIMDNKPMANVMPFGTCSAVPPTPAGPVPCVPTPTGPWLPGSQTVCIKNKPALSNSSKLMCGRGGVISIINPGANKVMVR